MIPDERYLKGYELDKTMLHDILAESRVIKNDEEIHLEIHIESHIEIHIEIHTGIHIQIHIYTDTEILI